VQKLLDQLVTLMVERGVQYEDATREFDKRFISEVIDKCDGNLCKAADTLGVHRNTLARKIKDLKIKARPSASA
jgi:DNA-binding NtrC family response regulator